jgi:hypothetical protein
LRGEGIQEFGVYNSPNVTGSGDRATSRTL